MRPIRSLALLLLLPGVALADKPSPPAGDPLVRANVAFAGDLLRALHDRPGNLFFSPYSISAALAMAREGAVGDTAREMDAALEHPPGGVGDGYLRIAKALAPRDLRTEDGPVPAYQLQIANAMWVQAGYPLRDTFGARLRDAYGATFEPLDFAKPDEARARINAWVEDATQKKIQDLIPAGMPPPSTRLILTNAVYFKASWQTPFSEEATQDGPFTGPEGKEVQVRLMRRTDHFSYGETERAQVVEIPYRGGDIGMVVVLPKAKDGLAAVEANERIDEWTGLLQGRAKVALSLPKFTYTTALDLGDTLQGLGMHLAFDPEKADFSGITDAERLFVGGVLHKAFVAVDEKGTEAAAATATMMVGTAMPRPEPTIEFKVDHPFLFFLRHRATGEVLFLGHVVDPTQS
jgi:serpin B